MVIKYKIDESLPWFGKWWFQGVPKQLDYDYNMNLRDLLERAVKKWPDEYYLWFLESFVTFSEFKDMVDRVATYLSNIGVKKGEVVALYLPNCIQYVVGYYAVTSIGAVVTGINPTYQALEVLHQLKVTDARYIIALDALFNGYITKILDQWEFKHVIYTNLVDLASGMSGLKKMLGKLIKKIPTAKVNYPNSISLLEVMKTKPNVPKVEIDAENDTATLIMTGGTTGVPKAAELTHQNVVSNAKQIEITALNQKDPNNPDAPALGPGTGNLGALPLYHSFAMTCIMNMGMATGGWAALFPRPPETEDLLHTLCKELPNINKFVYFGAEILFQRIANLPEETLAKYPELKDRLTACLSGAGPLHDYVRIPFEEKTGANITEGYGLTEASPVVTSNNLYGEREAGFIGVPLPGTDVRIFDQTDFEKGPITIHGEEGTGEICVCGPQVMKSYWKNPEATANNIKEWGGRRWLLTGDIGFMDEGGRFKIRDRKKQLIKMSGHSVFPAEVETLLGTHPKVLEVAVAGLPDEKTGEAVKAWVVLKPEAIGTIKPQELLSWSKENITYWKAPKYLDIIDEVPKNIIGKVLRRTLQEADPLWKNK